MHRTKVRIVEEALDANNTIARANRADFDRAGVTVVNFMSAPGAGKTTLLERVVGDLRRRPRRRAGGRRAGLDGRRPPGRPARAGHAAEHRSRLRRRVPPRRQHGALGAADLPLAEIDLLVIENVGNLVCPAEFRVGEDVRVMVSSVTEGEDKPLKYPLMFRTCDLVLVNKIDLLPHLDYDLDKFLYNLDQVHPDVRRMLVSARTGEGIDAWRDWLAGVAAAHRRSPEPAAAARPRRPRRRAARRGAPTPTGAFFDERPSGSPGSAT